MFKVKLENLKEEKKACDLISQMMKFNNFLLLEGRIGVGKTYLSKIIAKNLGIKENVTSPTFNICKSYQIKKNLWLNHFDFFRLKKNGNAMKEFKELSAENFNIIEWPKKRNNFWKEGRIIVVKISIRKKVKFWNISTFPQQEKIKEQFENF